MKRNVTLQLDEDTIRKARVLAARRGSSMSRLLADEIEALVKRDDDYELAMREALAELEKGFDFGGGPYPKRDEIYDRR